MDGKTQQIERDNVILELFQDSFQHIIRLMVDKLVLRDIKPSFPDLEYEYKQSFCEDKDYIDLKKKRDELVVRWGQHVNQAKKAYVKVENCEHILERIWNIRREFKIETKHEQLPSEFKYATYKHHMKVLIAVEKLLKSRNLINQLEKELVESKTTQTDLQEDKQVPVDDNTRGMYKAMQHISGGITAHRNCRPQVLPTSTSVWILQRGLTNTEVRPLTGNIPFEEAKLKEANEQIQTLKEKIKRVQAKYKSFKELEDQLKDANNLVQTLNEKNERNLTVITLTEEKAKRMVTTLQKEIKDEVKQKDVLMLKLKEQIKTTEDLSRVCVEKEASIARLSTEIEELTKRLNFGGIMVEQNQDCSDLCDPYRPKRLSEQLQGIFEGVRIDVLNYLTKTKLLDDEVAVKYIVGVLQVVYVLCKDQIEGKKEEVIKILGFSQDPIERQETGGKEDKDQTVKIINTLIRGSVKRFCHNVIQGIQKFPTIKDFLQKGEEKSYIFVNQCSQLCLYMAIHEPPLILDFNSKTGDPFNKDKLVAYTHLDSCETVDFLVWPGMYLGQSGTLICKGIAEGKCRNNHEKIVRKF